jgi:hypothetical protein
VVLAVEENTVIVHDPDGYVQVPVPLTEFLIAWKFLQILYLALVEAFGILRGTDIVIFAPGP